MPKRDLAIASASSFDLANLTPPALPRPPAWIWAFTTIIGVETSAIAACISLGLSATFPLGTGIYAESMVFAWYSCIFIFSPSFKV